MASSSRRPPRRAIRPIEREPRTTASFEQSKLLANHNDSNKVVAPQAVSPGLGVSVVAGTRVGSGTGGAAKIRGGTFAPRSNLGFR